MCGICGFSGAFSKEKLESMISSLKHRGPDSSGSAFFPETAVGLGHTRLAIIDLSAAGNQPMYDESGDIVIVFNGEIYNFQILRKELAGKYTFKSNSDTEVIINAYKEWGFDCLTRFNGMFSFVIYDRRKDLLFGARDKIGEKPLKYFYDGKDFLFASEIKALLAVLDKTPGIDPLAIHHFLTLQYVPAPLTGFKNIYKLPPAHYFVFKDNALETHKYWELDFAAKVSRSEEDWEDLIIAELERSVKMRMIADVPIGALLSGGLDSSSVVALMAKNSSKTINTFSIGFDNKMFDESPYADQVARLYGTIHNKLVVTSKDLMDLLPTLMNYYDEPIADNSILPTFMVSKLARQQVTVALDGDGGDENFAGYDRYTIVNFLSKYTLLTKGAPGLVAEMVAKLVYSIAQNKLTERAYRFAKTARGSFVSAYGNYNCFFTAKDKDSLYNSDFAIQTQGNNAFDVYKDIYNSELTYIDNALKIDINTYLPENLLFKTDIASMAYALELRAPLLDPDFMQLIANIPSNLKIKGGVKKYIFKKAILHKNILPAEIVNRKKRGFNVPLNQWFKGPLKDYVKETLHSDALSQVFNSTKLDMYVRQYYSTNLNYDNNIFALLVLSNWLNKYVKK